MEIMQTKVKGVILMDAGFTNYKNGQSAWVIINRIRFERLILGYTQKQLADYCCVSKNTISSIERGEFFPSSVLLMKISLFLHEDPEFLFQLVKAELIGDEYV